MAHRRTLFADILLPLPVKGCFTYRVPFELNDHIREGQRTVVPFGRNKVYAGLVKRIHETPPERFQARYLHAIPDHRPVVTPLQFAFWEWISKYYLCTEGEVMAAALPPAMKLAGKDLENPWRPKKVKYVALNDPYKEEDAFRELFDACERKAPRQLDVLMQFVSQAQPFTPQKREVRRTELTKGVRGGDAALQALIRKGVFRTYEKEHSYFDHLLATGRQVAFNEHQEKAWQQIHEEFGKKDVVLLHGVTSSGKTELYIRLIQETLDKGRQVLYLLPEIALTSQIIARLQQHFGNRAGIYHSRFSPMERTEVWNNLLDGGVSGGGETIRYDLVLGPRSAMFLPFRDLGLIIVDEEHEPSFKQHEPAPRYHARDAAIYLASIFGAKVLLGSATPSVEVYSGTRSGKFGYAGIGKRHGGVLMPEIMLANIRKDTRSRAMKSHFSPLLFESMQDALGAGEQVILFQNRRGFSLRLECDVCQWLPECHQCDVTLVYHKKEHRLRCHYCGHATAPPGECPSCTSPAIKMKGFGTEKIEEELPLFFPDATIARMDLDTTRSKLSYRKIIEDFENKRIDILVGTQMISKGLDFSNVGVVGVLNADNMLNFPDFRSHERAFQLMAQVSGRAGRSNKRGRVIIQTSRPDHQIIQQVLHNDYEGMYRDQIAERRKFGYPPFSRLILIGLAHADDDLLNGAAAALAERLREKFPEQVLGPEYPVVSRVRNQFIKNIMVKLGRTARLAGEKESLQKIVEGFRKETRWKPVRITFNVDPA